MKNVIIIWVTTLFFVISPMCLWYLFDAFVLGNCDPKFGCLGGLQFGVFILSICGYLSSFAVISAYALVNKPEIRQVKKVHLYTTICIGIILSGLNKFLFAGTLSVSGMVITWFLVSLAIASVAYKIQNNITKPS